MYRAFELKIDESILLQECFRRYAFLGKEQILKDDTDLKKLLKEVIFTGTIDGVTLSERYFPTLQRDVFISYSHHDQNLAYMMAGLLMTLFDLSVFIDSVFWGNADKLLKEIDDKYCRIKNETRYSYKKRNFSTAHVHAMLTSSIIKAMDQAEIVIFLNTPNSAPCLKETIESNGYDDYTLSPWIYEEILLTTMLKQTPWEAYRKDCRLDENSLAHFEKSLRVRYKLPKNKLIQLTIEDIYEWYEKYIKRKERIDEYGGLPLKPYEKEKHPLNILYEIKCGIDESELNV